MIEARAQSRARTRLVREKRERFRQIYVDAPTEKSRPSRRDWAITQLTHEYPERYRELYVEERDEFLAASGEQPSVDSRLVGKSSGSGPLHAVISGKSATLCGRSRFHTYPASTFGQVNCAYCIEKLRGKESREPDLKFRAQVESAKARIRAYSDLVARTTEARSALLDSLSVLRTPPAGTVERALLIELLGQAVKTELTLGEIGKPMNLSRERIRQIVAEGAELTGGDAR